jgi:hypothetical protein
MSSETGVQASKILSNDFGTSPLHEPPSIQVKVQVNPEDLILINQVSEYRLSKEKEFRLFCIKLMTLSLIAGVFMHLI